jgi:hypothetical protein
MTPIYTKEFLTDALFERRNFNSTLELTLRTSRFRRYPLVLCEGMAVSEVCGLLRTLADDMEAGAAASDAIHNARGPRPHLPAYAAPQLETSP